MKITSVISKEIYPLFPTLMAKNTNALKRVIGNFINQNHEKLYDTGPYHRIYFTKENELNTFNAVGIDERTIALLLQKAFFYDIPYNPPQIKEPFTVLMLMCIKYAIMKKNIKDAQMFSIYLAFSGKFYASVHGMSFRQFPPIEHRDIMEYAINGMSNKFLLVKEGTLFGAIASITNTWLDTYADIFRDDTSDDKEYGDIVQQLRDREKSFMKNVADLYYQAYEKKDYLRYESDSLDDSNYRITDNDASRAYKYTEKFINHVTSNSVDYKICTMCADQNIKKDEVKSIMETIIDTPAYLIELRQVVNILITDFMSVSKEPLYSIDFIAYSIKPKPNTKNKDLVYVKDTITGWLDENSPNYRKRKHRLATANSYYKAILQYIVLVINKIAK